MALDIIYLIIATPIVVSISFGVYAHKQRIKRIKAKPEATPYIYEKDAFITNFDEFTNAIYDHKFKRK